jgi:hypothetical protein
LVRLSDGEPNVVKVRFVASIVLAKATAVTDEIERLAPLTELYSKT